MTRSFGHSIWRYWKISWDDRDRQGKVRVVLSEAADRLNGMASILYCKALSHRLGGGHNGDADAFLAKSANDIARVLRSMLQIIRAEDEVEFQAELKAERAKTKRRKG